MLFIRIDEIENLTIMRIYPKEDRPLRDLLRTRMKFVEKRTSFKNSLTSIISRETGLRLTSDKILALNYSELKQLLKHELIYFRVCHYHSQIRLLTSSIDDIEKECLKKLKVTEEYKALTSILVWTNFSNGHSC